MSSITPRDTNVRHDGGGDIEHVETGEGPAVLFVPGSYSTAAAWRPIQRLLEPRWRMITTSLCGYGRSRETRDREDCGMRHEVRLVETICRGLDRPVHLVGHSFGATVALACALGRTVPVASLVCFEANPLGLIRDRSGGALFHETLRVSRDFESAVATGERDAPARIIDFWGGEGAFAAMPEPVKDYCRKTAEVNVLDWRTAVSYEVTPRECSDLQVPVLLVRGGLANPVMVAITDALHESLPQAQVHVVQGAGHFLISSHPARCAELLTSFLQAAD